MNSRRHQRLKTGLILAWSTCLLLLMRLESLTAATPGTVAEVVKRLRSPAQAEKVDYHFTGVVTYVDTSGSVCVQEGSSGIMVQPPMNPAQRLGAPKLGDQVDIQADVPALGPEAELTLIARSLRVLNPTPLPKPARPWLIETLNGAYDRQWVEVQATIMQARAERGVLLLHLVDNQGWGVARVEGWLENQTLTNLWGALVKVQGVNLGKGQSALRVPSPDFFSVVTPGKPSQFAVAETVATKLRNSPPTPDRKRLLGVVLRTESDAIYLRSAEIGVRASLLQPFAPGTEDPARLELIPPPIPTLSVGDHVEVVGSPLRTTPYLALSFASIQPLGSNTPPRPTLVSPSALASGGGMNDFITLTGRLLSREQIQVNKTTAETLKLENEGVTFLAILESARGGLLTDLKTDDLVELTGLLVPSQGNPPFVLKLANRSDARSLGVAPWVARQRFLRISGGIGLVVALAAAWILILRRQVRRRTQQLSEANEDLKAEVEERKRVQAVLLESESRLRASEQRFRTAFTASPALMVLTRFSDGLFVAANEAFLSACGYSEAEVIGRKASELNIYAKPEQRMEFRDLLKKQGVVRDREHLLLAKDGTVRTVLLSGEITLVDGEPHALTVGLDITVRKKAEQDTLRALDQERELHELKSRFVSMVSHEFRTPLGITMSAVELLRNYFDRLPEPKRQELFEDIHRATRQMAGLMEQVLVLGRVEAGKLVFRPGVFDLAVLCQKLVDESTSATHSRCPIELRLDSNLSSASGDESLLRHIFANLLSNAVKYSAPGSPVVFSVRREGEDAVFTVKDHGIGIPASERPKLFQAFYRAVNVGEVPGTGLGLLIVKRCLDLHGGSIDLDSQEQAGTTFVVRLPVFTS